MPGLERNTQLRVHDDNFNLLLMMRGFAFSFFMLPPKFHGVIFSMLGKREKLFPVTYSE